MARRIRIQTAGGLYHVLSRGDRGEAIFADDEDRRRFVATLGEGCQKTGWEVQAYVLMPNHFHLLVHPPEPNLVEGMQWTLGTYTVRYNARHGVRGHLFAGRYRSQLVCPAGHYAAAVADYIHLNPARAGLLSAGLRLRDYPWSSLRAFLGLEPRPAWLVMPSESQDPRPDTAEWEAHLESRQSRPEDLPLLADIRRGWYLGDEAFRELMLARVAAGAGENHHGEELTEAAEARAEGIVRRELARMEWSEEDLHRHAKGDGRKLALARRLRSETTMTLHWIEDRLAMGTAGYLSHLLYWGRRGMKPPKPEAQPGRTLTRRANPRRQEGRAGQGVRPAAAVDKVMPATVDAAPTTEPFAFDTSFD